MIFTSLALLSGLAMFSAAAPGYSPPAPVTHYVDVSDAKADLIYTPPYIYAEPGDTVAFKFYPKNHTVTQSTFDAPCSPLYGGINTGFIPVTLGGYEELPVREIPVKDKKPIWIYCAQGANTPASHCGKGMVFAVNPAPSPDGAESYGRFKAKALEIGKKLAGYY